MSDNEEAMSLVRKTPEWCGVCTFFTDLETGGVLRYGLDFDSMYEFMCSIPYGGD